MEIVCPKCKGTGLQDKETLCPECEGYGSVEEKEMGHKAEEFLKSGDTEE